MTVSSTLNKISYEGDGSNTTFNIPFYVLSESDLTFTIVNETTLAETIITDNFTLVPAAGGFPASTSEFTYPISGEAIAEGYKLIIMRTVPLKQETSFSQGAAIQPAVVEQSLDKLVMMIQQQAEELTRCIKAGISSGIDPEVFIAQIIAAAASATSQAETATAGATTATNQANLAKDYADSISPETFNAASASSPAYYKRNVLFSSAKTTITTPSRLWVNIGGNGYMLESATTLDLTLTASWDATGYETAASRAGKDFYIYACTPVSGTTPVIILSANSTIPTGYTEANSRKIGGFHCLCVAVGTIAGHTLTGYIAGDIIPASVWDLAHRPVSEPEGMAYVDGLDLWVDIYLCSYTGTTAAGTLKTQSVYAAVTADGASTEKFHWYKWAQTFGKQKKRMLKQMEFMVASLGSNQGTNITGSADANTAGGHIDTASRRMISNYGLEDCCGFLWQWGAEAGGSYSGETLANAYDANDANVGGQAVYAPNRVLLGGFWDNGVGCGSRGSAWSNGPLGLGAHYGSRGASEPLRGV